MQQVLRKICRPGRCVADMISAVVPSDSTVQECDGHLLPLCAGICSACWALFAILFLAQGFTGSTVHASWCCPVPCKTPHHPFCSFPVQMSLLAEGWGGSYIPH